MRHSCKLKSNYKTAFTLNFNNLMLASEIVCRMPSLSLYGMETNYYSSAIYKVIFPLSTQLQAYCKGTASHFLQSIHEINPSSKRASNQEHAHCNSTPLTEITRQQAGYLLGNTSLSALDTTFFTEIAANCDTVCRIKVKQPACGSRTDAVVFVTM